MIDLSRIAATPVVTEPFPHFAISGVLDAAKLTGINADFPPISTPGIHALSDLTYGDAFGDLIDDIQGDELARILSNKFEVDLTGLPLMVTVRGHCQKKDGRIHTDSTDKVVTCLLYLNQGWPAEGGRLRLLRSGTDMDDMIAEIPPLGGSFVAFKRTDNSWHGHHPFEGPRRYVMFNWVRSEAALMKNIARHKVSGAFKSLFSGY